MKKLTISIFLLALIIIPLSIFFNRNSSTYDSISPKEALDTILINKDNPNFILIDVRTNDEFESGFINGAINIDWPSNKDNLLSLEKNDTLLLYCQTGRRSKLAQNYLIKNGYRSVTDIKGGLQNWNQVISF